MISFVDAINPKAKVKKYLFDILCVLCGSLFLALISQFAIELWFTPVPISLQTLGVLLLGALLGSKKGALSVITYLGEGAIGFPVFADGDCGFTVLFGPKGGYLFAFVLSAFIIGRLLESGWKKSYFLTLSAFAIGSTIALAIGALWLSVFVGAQYAWMMGVAPFLVGDAIKVLVAGAMFPSGRKALNLFK